MERGNAWACLTPNTSPVRSQSLLTFPSCCSLLSGYFPEPASKVCTACVANCQICESVTTSSLCAAVSVDGTQNEWGGSAAHLPSAMHSRTRAPHRMDLVVGGPSYLSACSSFTSTHTHTHTGLQAVCRRPMLGLPCQLWGMPGHWRHHDLLHPVQCQLWPVQHGLVH